MSALKIIRYLSWGAVFLLLPLSLAIIFGWWQVEGRNNAGTSTQGTGVAQVGGAFTLINHKGEKITDETFKGKPLLVFFGFLACPDVCPTTLMHLTQLFKTVGKDADKIQVLFVSVDPDRDTSELMEAYIQSFDPRVVAATGTKQEIDAMVKTYKAQYEFVPTANNDYTVNHTALTFMMDSKGVFAGTIDYHEPENTALLKIKRLAKL